MHGPSTGKLPGGTSGELTDLTAESVGILRCAKEPPCLGGYLLNEDPEPDITCTYPGAAFPARAPGIDCLSAARGDVQLGPIRSTYKTPPQRQPRSSRSNHSAIPLAG